MKILLLIPTCYANYEQTDVYFPTPPLGIAYIASCLENANHEVKIFDILGRNEQIKPIIEKFKPDIIGIQCFTTGFIETKRLVFDIRKFYNGIIVIGGPHITAMKDEEMPDFPVDYFIRRDAEKTIVKIADGWMPSKKIIDGEIITDLDTLPFPARHLLNFNDYTNEPKTSMISSRGCPYKCTFCFDSHQWRKMRLRKPDAVVEEMKRVNKMFGFNKFLFMDDTFILNEDITHQYADLLENSKFTISCNTRCNIINEEIIKDMIRMNVDAFFVGVESGNQRLLNIMNKGITTEQIINTHELAKKYKIKIEAFMLMSIPTQTIKEMHEDFKFSTMLMKKYNSIIDYSIMYCYPNTPLFNYAKEKFPNKFDIKDWSLERHKWRFPNVPLYIEEGHNADELIALYKSFRFKINRMSIPKHKLPLLSAKYIARNLYRKTMHTFNKDFITGKR